MQKFALAAIKKKRTAKKLQISPQLSGVTASEKVTNWKGTFPHFNNEF